MKTISNLNSFWETFFTMIFIECAMSKVISFTLSLSDFGILSNCVMMGSALVPARIAPFLPFACLLVMIVYSSRHARIYVYDGSTWNQIGQDIV